MSEESHSQGGEEERCAEAGPGAESEAGGPAEVSQAEAGPRRSFPMQQGEIARAVFIEVAEALNGAAEHN